VYAAFLVCGAATLLGLVLVQGAPLATAGSEWALIPFAVLAFVVERESIPVSPTTEVSIAFLPVVFVAVVFGPVAAALVGAIAMLTAFPWRAATGRPAENVDRPFLRWIVWTSSRVLIAAAGGMAAGALIGDQSGARIAMATVAALVAIAIADVSLTGLTLRIRGTENPYEAVKAAAKVTATGVPIYGAVAGLLAYAYLAVTPLAAALFFIPALAAQRFFVVSRKQQDGLASLATANERLERANLSFATALVATLDARDRYTAGHSEAVAMYACDIAREFGWPAKDQQLVDLCGLVHDIGKIGLPAGLLEKPGALTAEERLQMETHSEIGERIVANVDDYAEIAVIVRHHHERWDGGGYPDGLGGTDIPIISRVLAVADAYDAMTSHRPYRAALPCAEARRRLREGAESQFDPDVVAAFEAVLERAHPQYLAGRAGSGVEEHARSDSLVALAS
jgi:putative nucleotidyltransferase with HDIG domain